MGIMSFVKERMNQARLDEATKVTQRAEQAEKDETYYKYMTEKQAQIDKAGKLKAKYKHQKRVALKKKFSNIKKNIQRATGDNQNSIFRPASTNVFYDDDKKKKKKQHPVFGNNSRNPIYD